MKNFMDGWFVRWVFFPVILTECLTGYKREGAYKKEPGELSREEEKLRCRSKVFFFKKKKSKQKVHFC